MEFKFMSFNIQSCRDYIKRDFNPLLMANTIKNLNPDIIGLNEVRGEGSHQDFINQTKIIAEYLSYEYYFFGKAIDLPYGPYGNAIISRYPINNVTVINIPDPLIKNEDAYYETRAIIKAEINNFTVLITHIGLANSEKINALNTLIDLIDNITTPIVLMGDFNIVPTNAMLIPIKNRLNDTASLLTNSLLSFPSINPIKKIDYIFVSKDIIIIDADIPRITASDHYPYTATLDIK